MNKEIVKKIFAKLPLGTTKENLFGELPIELIENHQCPICTTTIDFQTFRNDISRIEYTISGLCQQCQDKIFGKD